MSQLHLSQIFTYPVKSLAGLSQSSAEVTPTGLANDRLMMLVDSAGQFVTQRAHPQLALMTVEKLADGSYRLQYPQAKPLLLDRATFRSASIPVTIWGDQCAAQIADDSTNQWFSDFLGFQVSLVEYNNNRPRAVDPDYGQQGDIVSFADGFPLLVISQASLDDLNQRLNTPVSMQNFRPNLVVADSLPYAEDNWRQLRIGDCLFEAVKPCSRCVLTTVDPHTGIKHPQQEPLRTLGQYRKQPQGVMFGMNLIARSFGKIRQGDSLEILPD